MAKKTTKKKKTPVRKKAAGSSSKKTTTRKKPAAKKSPAKKAPAKKTPSKKKPTAKKSTAKKTTKKTAAKKTTKKTTKKAATKKTTSKKTTAKKPASKKTTTKKTTSKKTTSKKAPAKKAATKKKTTKKKTSRRRGDAGRGRSVGEVAVSGEADKDGYVFVNGRRVRMISTKGLVKPKKTRAESDAEEAAAAEASKPKPVKTKLSKKELKHYTGLLMVKRAELFGDLNALEEQALRSGGGDISHMPIHMADIGSDTYDQDFMLGLAENERKRLRDIDDALARVRDNTYGVCQMTGKQIPKARLDAKPWAKYTIEAKRQLEGGWGG